MDLKSTYNKIAEEWRDDHLEDNWWQVGTDKFLSFLPKGASILDVGCGPGLKTQYLNNKGFDVFGVDFSEKMIEIAKREYPSIDFDVLDVYDTDKYPRSVDAVFAQAVLLHIPKKRILEVLNKFSDRLNKDGLIYLAVKATGDDGVTEEVKTENDYGYEYDRFFSYFSLPELCQYMKDSGFEVLWQSDTLSGRTHWLQLVGRKN